MTDPPSALRVLLVEDDPAYARVVRYTLPGATAGPFAVEIADRLSAALERLRQERFDAVLLDALLPDASGIEGVRAIGAAFPEMPIVLLTVTDDPALGVAAVQAGAQDHLVKGRVEEELLPRAIRHAVERKRMSDTLRRLEKAVGTMQLGVSITDLGGRVIYANPAEAAMHGYEPSALVGRDARALSPPEDWRPAAPDEMAKFTTWKRERVRMRSDGTRFPVQLMSDVVKDEGGRPIGIVTTCEDITERRRAEEALRKSEERYALAVRGTNDGIWDWDLVTNRVYYSPRWKAIVGCAEDEVSGSPDEWLSRVHADDIARVRERIEAHLQGRSDRFEDEHRMRHKDGTYRWVLSRGYAARDASGQAHRMAGAQTDTTDRRGYDALTGLPNRAVFVERVTEAVARAERVSGAAFAVLFVDLDRFKDVNDRFGHAAGDRYLIEVARRLQDGVRPGDVVARLSGDEFAVLLERLETADVATVVADRILHEVGRPLALGGGELTPGVSIGIAMSETGYTDARSVLQDADAAMYRAKADGRGRWEVFDDAMRDRVVARQRLQDELRGALERGELSAYFQPIVHLASSELRGFEALLRWRGVVLPVDALAATDDASWVGRIATWLLEESCRCMARWQSLSPAAACLKLSLNLPGWPLQRPELATDVEALLARTGLGPRTLVLEVTEDALLREGAAATAGRLAAAGVGIRLDRFGLGATALRALNVVPLEGVKVDAALAATKTPEATTTLAAICAIAAARGYEVAALGVESEEDRARVAAAGCVLGQGPLFSDPLTAGAVEALLGIGDAEPGVTAPPTVRAATP